MRKLTIVLAVCVSSVAVAKFWGQSQAKPATKSARAAAALTYVIHNFYENGSSGPSDVLFQAYRSDGSFGQYLLTTTGLPPIRSVTNYQKMLYASIDPVTKSVVTWPIRGSLLVPTTCEGAYGAGNCLGTSGTVLGFAVEKAVRSGADGVVTEFLAAPALDFAYLKRTDVMNGRTVQEWDAIDVRLGEPDARIFEIPVDFEVVPRNVFYERGTRARGRAPNAATLDMFRDLDAKRTDAVASVRVRTTSGKSGICPQPK